MTRLPNTEATVQESTLFAHAYLDGELDVASALSIKRQIDADPALASEVQSIESLRQVLRERFPREQVPPNLRSRINAAVGFSSRWSKPTWRALAASVLLAVGVSSGSTWFALRAPQDEQVFEEVVSGHMRALMAPAPTDVGSSERHIVKPWFNGRIPQAPRVVDLGSKGFPLLGARIDVIGTKLVPTLVYGRRRHIISVSAVSNGSSVALLTTRRTVNGYNVVRWSSDGISYLATSDLNAAELETFAKEFQSAPG